MTYNGVLHVTFDRNVCSSLVRAGSHAATGVAEGVYCRLLEAMREGSVCPYLSEATLTFELFSPSDRLLVLAAFFARGELRPTMPSPTREAQAWVDNLLSLGFRVLHGPPRLGMRAWVSVGEAWAEDKRFPIKVRQERQAALVKKFEDLGEPRLRKWGQALAEAHGLHALPLREQPYSQLPGLLWYNGLMAEYDRPKCCSSRADFLGKLRRIFSDWFDLDSVASHYGYGLDYFCTDETRRGNPNETIFHPTNREVLERDFGVRIVSAQELDALVRDTLRR